MKELWDLYTGWTTHDQYTFALSLLAGLVIVVVCSGWFVLDVVRALVGTKAPAPPPVADDKDESVPPWPDPATVELTELMGRMLTLLKPLESMENLTQFIVLRRRWQELTERFQAARTAHVQAVRKTRGTGDD